MFKSRKPNILLIVLDTARACNFSCYGYSRETTPAIDKLAREGVLYWNAVSASPWTLPSHASIFTGMFPSKHGAHEKHKYLSSRYWTLAELLRFNGYETIAISNNSWISKHFGLDRGFSTFLKIWQVFQTETDFGAFRREYVPSSSEELVGVLKLVWKGNVIKNLINGVYGKFFYRRYDYGARRINNKAKEWLFEYYRGDGGIAKANGRTSIKPFFMFINYLEPHLRYEPPGKYRTMYLPDRVSSREASGVNQDAWAYMAGIKDMDERDFEILRALYDGELRYLDFRIQELISFLDEINLLNNTMIIITSDHGENIGEHNMMDHQYCLYDTLLKVPLIIRFPEVFPSGHIVEEQVQTIDIFPTIMDLLGIDHEEVKQEIQGEILLPEELKFRKRKFAISEYIGPQPSMESIKKMFPESNLNRYNRGLTAIRTRDFKYIKATDGKDELYNIEKDPSETDNLIMTQNEMANELRNILENWEKTYEKSLDQAEIDVDRATLKRLKDLGYI